MKGQIAQDKLILALPIMRNPIVKVQLALGLALVVNGQYECDGVLFNECASFF